MWRTDTRTTHRRTTAFLHAFPLQRCCEGILNGLVWQWCHYKWNIYEFIKIVCPNVLINVFFNGHSRNWACNCVTTYVAKLNSSFEIISNFQELKSNIDCHTCFQFGHNFYFCATTEWISKKLGINWECTWSPNLYFSCWSVDKDGHPCL